MGVDDDKRAAALHAAGLVESGMRVGLGTGTTVAPLVAALGERGLDLRCVATSPATEQAAHAAGLRIEPLDALGALDIAIDGADQIAPDGWLIKGGGRAHTREKIVAAAARRFVVLVGSEKLVDALGAHGTLPVEVVPFALAPVRRRLEQLGLNPVPRQRDGKLFTTDNANHILDCRVGPLARPAELECDICTLPGVVDTGLFLGMAHAVLIGTGGTVEVRERPGT